MLFLVKKSPKFIGYLGSDFKILFNDFKTIKYSEIYDIISDEIINGKIIGWYQGRSESSPRALGNRSILVLKNYIIRKK